MNKRKLIELGELITESKIPSSKPNPNKRIKVKLNVAGVEIRPFTNDKEGATKYYIRKAGQFIYGRQNLFKGAFGIVPKDLDGFESSSDIPAFDVKENCLPEWIFLFFKQGDYYKKLEVLAKGIGSRRIHPEDLYKLQIPLPTIEEQKTILFEIQKHADQVSEIFEDSKLQINNVHLLRQSILREAIQGKLVPQNPNEDPAHVLLKTIQSKKEKLIKEGTLRKEQPLLPISPDEIPFELPKHWVWCRLQQVGILQRGKSKHRPRNDFKLFKEGTYPLVQTGDVSKAKNSDGLVTTYTAKYNEIGLKQSKLWDKGTLCITIAANIAETGFLNFDACFPDSIVGFTSEEEAVSRYMQFFLEVTKSKLEDFAPSTAQKNINLEILNSLLFPLPPLAEQKRIVKKVDKLIKSCSELEENINEYQVNAGLLIQSILQEAFDPIA